MNKCWLKHTRTTKPAKQDLTHFAVSLEMNKLTREDKRWECVCVYKIFTHLQIFHHILGGNLEVSSSIRIAICRPIAFNHSLQIVNYDIWKTNATIINTNQKTLVTIFNSFVSFIVQPNQFYRIADTTLLENIHLVCSYRSLGNVQTGSNFLVLQAPYSIIYIACDSCKNHSKWYSNFQLSTNIERIEHLLSNTHPINGKKLVELLNSNVKSK